MELVSFDIKHYILALLLFIGGCGQFAPPTADLHSSPQIESEIDKSRNLKLEIKGQTFTIEYQNLDGSMYIMEHAGHKKEDVKQMIQEIRDKIGDQEFVAVIHLNQNIAYKKLYDVMSGLKESGIKKVSVLVNK